MLLTRPILTVGQRLGSLLTVALLLFACTAGPDYVRPKAATPSGYKEAQGWKLAEPSDAAPRGKWWELYGDRALNGLVEQVQVSNQTVQIAEARYRQALALIDSAQASNYPTLTGAVSETRGRSVPPGTTATTARASVSANWELDLWGRIRRTVELNRADAQASAGDLGAALLSAQAALVQSYIQLRVVDAQRDLLEQSIASYERALEINRHRYAAGVAQRTDVTQAIAQLKSTQAQVIDLGAQRAQLEHAIATLIGKPPAEFAIERVHGSPNVPEIPLVVPSQLLERRPDVAAAERRMAAANANIGVLQASVYPALSLTATGGYQGTSFGDLLSAPARFWAVGPSLAGTLFDGGAQRALKAQAIAAYDASVAAYRQTVLSAFQDVDDSLASLQTLRGEIAVQRDAAAAAAETLRLTENQYKAGTLNYLNVIVAQNTSLTAERASLDIEGRRLAASVALLKALGGGWHGLGRSGPAKAVASSQTGPGTQ